MKIEFDADEVKAIILKEAQRYNPKVNTIRGVNWSSIPNVIVSYESLVDDDEPTIAQVSVEQGLPA